jgi:hypothetical protein
VAHSRDPRRRRFDLSPILNWANALRALGVVGFLHELVIYDGEERAQILVLCGVLLGLPEFVGRDRNGRR